MPASLIHLVRHGEVHNPDRLLYGRLAGFGLSDLGKGMAAASATSLAGRPITRLYASPLQRAQESAAPWSKLFGLEIRTEDRIIEPTNRFEGMHFEFGPKVLLRPKSWPWVLNPRKPSWGEPYVSIAERMFAAIEEAWHSTEGGEVVLVSHQLPIWTVHRALAGLPLYHDPRKRRCSLSSITTLARRDPPGPGGYRFIEVDYQDPARELQASATDRGAV